MSRRTPKEPQRRPDEIRIAIRMPARLGDRLQALAAFEHNGLSAVARRLISEGLEQEMAGGSPMTSTPDQVRRD